MFKISVGTGLLVIIHLLLNDVAFAGVETREGIQLRSWTQDTPVIRMVDDPILLDAFTDSIIRQLVKDEEFSNLHDVKVIEVQEGDSTDHVRLRFTAKDQRWLSAGTLIFDAEIGVQGDGTSGAFTVTAWSAAAGGEYQSGPRYDLPRALILP